MSDNTDKREEIENTLNGSVPTNKDDTSQPAQAVQPSPKRPPRKRRRRRNTEGCNCSKSKCLKLYCECYSKQRFCGPTCNCVDCHNLDAPEYEEARFKAIEHNLDRNSSAFHRAPTHKTTELMSLMRKGCKCRKSMCNKNYCECYQAEKGCLSTCRCENCQNTFGVKVARKRKRLGEAGGAASGFPVALVGAKEEPQGPSIGVFSATISHFSEAFDPDSLFRDPQQLRNLLGDHALPFLTAFSSEISPQPSPEPKQTTKCFASISKTLPDLPPRSWNFPKKPAPESSIEFQSREALEPERLPM